MASFHLSFAKNTLSRVKFVSAHIAISCSIKRQSYCNACPLKPGSFNAVESHKQNRYSDKRKARSQFRIIIVHECVPCLVRGSERFILIHL